MWDHKYLWIFQWSAQAGKMMSIPVGTHNTMAWVHGIGRVYKLRYHTCTHKTRDLKPAGFPVPVVSPNNFRWSCFMLDDYTILFSRFWCCELAEIMECKWLTGLQRCCDFCNCAWPNCIPGDCFITILCTCNCMQATGWFWGLLPFIEQSSFKLPLWQMR